MRAELAKDIYFTYDDYLVLPRDGKQYQIIEGELFVSPAPIPEHQNVLINIFRIVDNFVREHNLGKIYLAPTDIIFSHTSIVQPDILFIAKKRLNIITKKNIISAPDLCIEILSEYTEKTDKIYKKLLYERHRVKEYWIVDVEKKGVEVNVLKNNKYKLTEFKKRGKISSSLLKGLKVEVEDIFEK